MKKLILMLVSICSVLASQNVAKAWGYYGTFYWGTQQTGAFEYNQFAPLSLRHGFGKTLTWSRAPSSHVLMLTASAYPADFAITTASTLRSFMSYGAYSSYKTLSRSVGMLALRPGAAGYGFGARNQQPVTNRRNVDYFKSFSYTVQGLPDYVAGTNPRKNGNRYAATTWVRSGTAGGAVVSFPLVENPSSTQSRKFVHSLTIPVETAGGSFTRYVWYNLANLSASSSSALYIIPASQYSTFINGGSVSTYARGSGSPQELKLPAGSYYVVATNAININTIHAGSVVSQVCTYR